MDSFSALSCLHFLFLGVTISLTPVQRVGLYTLVYSPATGTCISQILFCMSGEGSNSFYRWSPFFFFSLLLFLGCLENHFLYQCVLFSPGNRTKDIPHSSSTLHTSPKHLSVHTRYRSLCEDRRPRLHLHRDLFIC